MSTDEIKWEGEGKQWPVPEAEQQRQFGVRASFELLGLRHVSASQIAMYQRCPRQWAFRYVLGIKRPPDGGLVVGSGVHAGAEAGMITKKATGDNPDREQVAEIAFEY